MDNKIMASLIHEILLHPYDMRDIVKPRFYNSYFDESKPNFKPTINVQYTNGFYRTYA